MHLFAQPDSPLQSLVAEFYLSDVSGKSALTAKRMAHLVTLIILGHTFVSSSPVPGECLYMIGISHEEILHVSKRKPAE